MSETTGQTQNELNKLLKFLDENGIKYELDGSEILIKGRLTYVYPAGDYTNYEVKQGKKTIFYNMRGGFQSLTINRKRQIILYDSFAFYNYPYFIIVVRK
ncbi:MAG: hypothetical protein JHC26_04420 [Thermofilum sp.]|jgi:hypothetical protein|uniref:hypothetical protein n=1 Tax=Thermofilum sp. TaxID=1961369 RepID=UPI00258670DD|nr:hypothetical protein [Thermofilum sp.]MCI4408312.1 hypothetical protein [Thermofilum sp.]